MTRSRAANGFLAQVPDPGQLAEQVLAAAPNAASKLHGVHHWQCVAEAGLQLVRHTPGADQTVVFLFALFHDSMRLDDSWDLDHGSRASEFVRGFQTGIKISPAQRELLAKACADHTRGQLSQDPTLACCWDADRLNLWRIGVKPSAKYLSTETASQQPTIEAARRRLSKTFSWPELAQRYAQLS
jgi:uncharacterized protein